jgi:hypothetical protein
VLGPETELVMQWVADCVQNLVSSTDLEKSDQAKREKKITKGISVTKFVPFDFL